MQNLTSTINYCIRKTILSELILLTLFTIGNTVVSINIFRKNLINYLFNFFGK